MTEITAQATATTLNHPLHRGRRWLRFSLRWLIVATAFLAVLVSHVKASLDLRTSNLTIERQLAELQQLRDELGVIEIADPAKAHVIFVRQNEDKSWRWRIYLPPGGRYKIKWAVDDIPTKAFAANWHGQDLRIVPREEPTFLVDLFIRKGADGSWRCFVRHASGEMQQELSERHILLWPHTVLDPSDSPQPTVQSDDIVGRNGVSVFDPREPLVLFRCQVIPQFEYEAAQTQGKVPDGSYDGIMVWIEPAK